MIAPSPLWGEGWGEGNLHIGVAGYFLTGIFIGKAGIILYILKLQRQGLVKPCLAIVL